MRYCFLCCKNVTVTVMCRPSMLRSHIQYRRVFHSLTPEGQFRSFFQVILLFNRFTNLVNEYFDYYYNYSLEYEKSQKYIFPFNVLNSLNENLISRKYDFRPILPEWNKTTLRTYSMGNETDIQETASWSGWKSWTWDLFSDHECHRWQHLKGQEKHWIWKEKRPSSRSIIWWIWSWTNELILVAMQCRLEKTSSTSDSLESVNEIRAWCSYGNAWLDVEDIRLFNWTLKI